MVILGVLLGRIEISVFLIKIKNKIISNLKFAFIGCGLIGNKRANTISKNSIVGCYDIDKKKSELFAKKFFCKSYKNFNQLIKDSDVVIICTSHKYLDKFTLMNGRGYKSKAIKKFKKVN